MNERSDVIVIGGGIAGISAAAEIARDARVTVLEAEPVTGYHATGRSAAIYIRNYGNAVLRAINAASEPTLAAPGALCDHSLLSPRGELLIASESEMPKLQAYAADAVGLERLSAVEAAQLVPILRPERIAAAIYEPGAQSIDVDAMLQGYTRLLKARQGKVITKSPVTAITSGGGHWKIAAGGASYSAPVVVNAAGAWADAIAAIAGTAQIGLQPMRRSAAILNLPPEHDVMSWPLFGNVSDTWYAKPEGGKLMVSPADEDAVEPHDAWPDDMVLAEGLDRYEQAVTVPVTRVERSWAGLRSFVPDRTPVVGMAPDAPGFFWLAGQGGYGVQTAPALSQLAAALILQRGPTLDPDIVAAIAPDRLF
ncbi:D-arginine dehydrogenase [Roseovarius nanhaiticus]|uniref:D-arginine dehydrogenase n=1 Tax=Roseovarius nanhaiticus TaxID=573024 RepID=A0A1N7GGE8_9RHOB|nr:FAD-binding oxidoreductase [Roseovarius nanhaiticus]SEK26955.1 D-arginine dehydrogenase [Roseovarius nanhaiticus]SIS11588.1 D-arginine dehydrogenase [Roseovarius nanhaiticus]